MNGIIQWLGDTVRLWGRSLAIFAPSNVALFGLVTLNAIIKAYVEIILRWWWLIGVTLASSMVAYQTSFNRTGLALWIMSIVSMLFIFYLMIRPSIDRKNLSYVLQYKRHFGWFFLYVFLMVFSPEISWSLLSLAQAGGLWMISYVPYAVMMVFGFITRLPILTLDVVGLIRVWSFHPPKFLLLFLISYTSFFIFFLLDTRGSFLDMFKSLYRAALMQLYTFPLALIGTMLSYLVYYVLQGYVLIPVAHLFEPVIGPEFGVLLIATGSVLLIPIIICFWSNVYIKQIHDNFKMYCGTQC